MNVRGPHIPGRSPRNLFASSSGPLHRSRRQVRSRPPPLCAPFLDSRFSLRPLRHLEGSRRRPSPSQARFPFRDCPLVPRTIRDRDRVNSSLSPFCPISTPNLPPHTPPHSLCTSVPSNHTHTSPPPPPPPTVLPFPPLPPLLPPFPSPPGRKSSDYLTCCPVTLV